MLRNLEMDLTRGFMSMISPYLRVDKVMKLREERQTAQRNFREGPQPLPNPAVHMLAHLVHELGTNNLGP